MMGCDTEGAIPEVSAASGPVKLWGIGLGRCLSLNRTRSRLRHASSDSRSQMEAVTFEVGRGSTRTHLIDVDIRPGTAH